MEIVIYSKFLNLTSMMLNLSIRLNFWWLSNKLILIRKSYIAKKLRKKLSH